MCRGQPDRRAVLAAGEAAGHLEPADVGEVDVQQDHVGRQPAGGVEPGAPAGRLAHDLVALLLQEGRHQRAEAGVVVDDEEGRHCNPDSGGLTPPRMYG